MNIKLLAALGLSAALMGASAHAEEDAGTRGNVSLVNELDVSGFGAAGLRLGDLDGDGRLDIVLAQNVGQSITRVTAIDIEGKMLWQVGEPKEGNSSVRFDLPVQICDIDADATPTALYDGHGQRVAVFPFPHGGCRAQHADMLGDEREEIVLWNSRSIRIYKNAAESDAKTPASRPQTKRLYNYTHYIGMP